MPSLRYLHEPGSAVVVHGEPVARPLLQRDNWISLMASHRIERETHC